MPRPPSPGARGTARAVTVSPERPRSGSTPTPRSTVTCDNNAAGRHRDVSATGQGTATGGNKQANYGFAEYARLYPGFDGIAANGLKYGANLEIRQDQSGGAGGGAHRQHLRQQTRTAPSLYFRRVWGYLGTDQLGTIRFGSTDQPTSLYMTGNFENFNNGGWNGDVPGFIAATRRSPGRSPTSATTTRPTRSSTCRRSSSASTSASRSSRARPTSAPTAGCGAAPVGATSSTGGHLHDPAARRQRRRRPGLRPSVLVADQRRVGAPPEHVRRAAPLPRQLRPGRRRGDRRLHRRRPRARQPDRRAVQQQPAAPAPVRYNYEGLSVGDFGAAVTCRRASASAASTVRPLQRPSGARCRRACRTATPALVGASYTFGPADRRRPLPRTTRARATRQRRLRPVRRGAAASRPAAPTRWRRASRSSSPACGASASRTASTSSPVRA